MAKIRDLTRTQTIYRKKMKTAVLRIAPGYINLPDIELQTIGSPQDVYEVLHAVFGSLDDDQEHLVLLVLNIVGDIIGYKLIASGGQDRAIVDAKIVFRNALLLGASKIILAHNHPSGRLDPSEADLQITAQLVGAGRMLDMEVVDHIIYAEQGFTSIRKVAPSIFLLEELPE